MSRLPRGGRVDRSTRLEFTFDGREYAGLAGDTVASALMACGVRVVARSVELRRPRGIYTAGPEEPNALVHVAAPVPAPMVPATTTPLVSGMVVQSLAGKGIVTNRTDLPAGKKNDKGYLHCELLVIGGGGTGRAEAVKSAGSAARVVLIEARRELDGPVPDDVRVLTGTTALGIYDRNYVVAVEERPTGSRLWHIHCGSIVLATGALERPIVFEDNDRPGVMLAGAALEYVERFAVKPGNRAVVFTSVDGAYEVAGDLDRAGVDVADVVDARTGRTVIGTVGEPALEKVLLSDGTSIDCDLLAVSGGWDPLLHLAKQPAWCDVSVRTKPGVQSTYWQVPEGDPGKKFVDLARDVTVQDMIDAIGQGFGESELLKRHTTIGTGPDQGKTSGVVARGVLSELLGSTSDETTFRPPYEPVRMDVLAGRERAELYDPIRATPLHARHLAHDAVFEDVGQWKRPWYFPRPGEDMQAAVARECHAARTSVAMMDASTLGKIELRGPDTGQFLDRIYTNRMSNLKIGHCRYGMMCRADGMVFDDGVVARFGADEFYATTTTGNAAAVLDWMEEWLQTEWPGLSVYATSVTDHWATIALVGPNARRILEPLTGPMTAKTGGLDDFPFMTFRLVEIAGRPARVFRVSFSGELAYEINVLAEYATEIWDALIAAGVTPYGTETMHVLRAEKGFAIVGQETDGTVTPQDLGMGWIVSKQKDFIGNRSHHRIDTRREDRKRLAGLLPDDPHRVLPEGAQVVTEAGAMTGHVTSSYHSATLGRSFALAMLANVAPGQKLWADGAEVTVREPVFYDPEGSRRDGDPS